MIRHTRLEHRFVQHIPDVISPGVLYISMEYRTAVHSCCCGCGEEIVTPFTPTDWKMTFDGETVSLHPSIGNWSLDCRSHYVVKRDRIIEACPWSDTEIEAEHRRNQVAKARYYRVAASRKAVIDIKSQPYIGPASNGFWQRLQRWVRGKL